MSFLYGELLFHYPWKFILLPLLRSDFEDVKRGFVDEKCVDEGNENFVCIMQELKDYWFLDVLKGYRIFEQELA
jgi:hypothetical protein